MKDVQDVVFIIQSRKDSTRVPNKMLRPFANSCLFEIAIQKVLNSKIIPKENFYVSVCDKEFVDIANKYGVNVYRRSRESTVEPIELPNVFEWHDKLPHKYYVIINACNALLKIETIDAFIKDFLKSGTSGQFGVVEKKTFFFNKGGKMINGFFGEDKYLATLETKFVEPVYEAAHSLYAGTVSDIAKEIFMGTFKKSADPSFFILNEDECFDIDWPWQFEIAEKMYKIESRIKE